MSGGRSKGRLLALPGNEATAKRLAERLGWDTAPLIHRRFPDGESYLRIDADLNQCSAVVVATLNDPDAIIPSLLFVADLARDLGAVRVGLVCPYLCYMRQDQRFRPGEALTSKTFARCLSAHFDWLVTVDPHLHRYASLDEIYTLESEVLTAAPAIADWVDSNIDQPVLIGPDGESEQWIRAVAEIARWPWRVFKKTRHGDRDVQMELPALDAIQGRQPVLIDDIISSGSTIAEATRHLCAAGLAAPVVVGVHGLHDERARHTLQQAGVARLICTNSVANADAGIDLSGVMTGAIHRLARAGQNPA